MVSLEGYFDGSTVKTLEKINAKKNQKLIITVLDEFMEETPGEDSYSAKGILSDYANLELTDKESKAWEKAVIENNIE